MTRSASIAALALLLGACARPSIQIPVYDMLIRHGTVYDGLGGTPYVGDVGKIGDRIEFVGDA